jgi:hypothetical protein
MKHVNRRDKQLATPSQSAPLERLPCTNTTGGPFPNRLKPIRVPSFDRTNSWTASLRIGLKGAASNLFWLAKDNYRASRRVQTNSRHELTGN